MAKYFPKFEFLGVLLLALFSGCMFFIAVCLLPYWAALPAMFYQGLFRSLAPYVAAVMLPLMFSSIAISAICAGLGWKSGNRLWPTAFGLVVVILPLYLAVHAPVNSLLLGSQPLTEAQLVDLRTQWGLWHWARTALGLGAFVVSIVSLGQRANRSGL